MAEIKAIDHLDVGILSTLIEVRKKVLSLHGLHGLRFKVTGIQSTLIEVRKKVLSLHGLHLLRSLHGLQSAVCMVSVLR